MPCRSAPSQRLRAVQLLACAALVGSLAACNQLLGNVPLDVHATGDSSTPDAAMPDAGSCSDPALSSCHPDDDAGPSDPCTNRPCVRGSCHTLDEGGFRCDCPSGYDGPTCAHAIEGCSAEPCVRGSCKNLSGGGYECVCPKGYDGVACEHDIDECATKPCQHGNCKNLAAGGGYECACQRGFDGTNCEHDIDECAAKPCLRGTCTNLADGGGYQCVCPAGYDGTNCEHDIDECAAAPCVRGSCMNLPAGGYQCSCPAGYDGMNCQHDIDECAPKPCVHGTCADKVNAYQCSCQAGWGGATCAAGSCSNVSCAATAPCNVPAGNAGLCLPTACGSQAGLCLAFNPDGGGNASSELLTETNNDWNFGTNNNWNKQARYFAYVHAIGNFPYVCVFPELNLGGTPIVIPLGQARSAPAGFGQSNAFSNVTQCSAHAP